MPKPVKCVLVGDDSVGKRGILVAYTTDNLPTSEYTPSETAVENYATNIIVDQQEVTLNLWFTAGSEEYDKLRPISYADTDVFLILFSITDPLTLDHAVNKWYKEVNQHCPKAPVILVGTKMDLREDSEQITKLRSKGIEPISANEGAQKAREIKAVKYVECSAFQKKTLKQLFEDSVRIAFENNMRLEQEKRNQQKGCSCIIV